MSHQRDAAQLAYQRRKTIATALGTLLATKKRRCVRITIIAPVRLLKLDVADNAALFVDLHDEELDRVIRRLQAIRGGRKAAK